MEYHTFTYDSIKEFSTIRYNTLTDKKVIYSQEINSYVAYEHLHLLQNNLRTQCQYSFVHLDKIGANYLVGCGYFDSSIRYWDIFNDDFGSAIGHISMVTCIDSSEDGIYVVAGGMDCIVSVWRLYNTLPPTSTYDGDVIEDHFVKNNSFYVKVRVYLIIFFRHYMVIMNQ